MQASTREFRGGNEWPSAGDARASTQVGSCTGSSRVGADFLRYQAIDHEWPTVHWHSLFSNSREVAICLIMERPKCLKDTSTLEP